MTTACAEAHLAHLTVKKAVESSAEILVSVSRRTISGSFRPALANSCKADGIVAENSSVCAVTQQKLDDARCSNWRAQKTLDVTCYAVHSPAHLKTPWHVTAASTAVHSPAHLKTPWHATAASTAVAVCLDSGMNRGRHGSLYVLTALALVACCRSQTKTPIPCMQLEKIHVGEHCCGVCITYSLLSTQLMQLCSCCTSNKQLKLLQLQTLIAALEPNCESLFPEAFLHPPCLPKDNRMYTWRESFILARISFS